LTLSRRRVSPIPVIQEMDKLHKMHGQQV
jgi:hypothetical protein